MQQKQTLWRRYMPVLLFVLILVIFSLLPSSPAVWRDVRRACGLGTFSDAADRAPFAFHVLDVGKADSLLLECAGEAMLVDEYEAYAPAPAPAAAPAAAPVPAAAPAAASDSVVFCMRPRACDAFRNHTRDLPSFLP